MLKSLVGRLLRYTLNSGTFLLVAMAAPSTASTISLMFQKVLGPEEHPRSAIPMFLGQLVDTNTFFMASTTMRLTLSEAFFRSWERARRERHLFVEADSKATARSEQDLQQ